MKIIAIWLTIMLCGVTSAMAQAQNDTLTQEIRSYIARNFSEARTFNLYWETTPSHRYSLKQHGSITERGKMRSEHTVKFATTIPVFTKKQFALYANGVANFYMFETSNNNDNSSSMLFSRNEDSYSYYSAALSGTYKTKLFNKPLILTASVGGDGWLGGFEKLYGSLSAVVVVKHTPTTTVSVGLYGMTLFELVPSFPIIAFMHQFNSNLSIDITLPSRLYLRYQLKENHRLSFGSTMSSENFYMRPGIAGVPKTCLYSNSKISTEFVYEHIISKRFYLIARGGASQILRAGLFGTNRKGIDHEPYIEYKQPITPFFNVGFSYNLFK